VTAGPAAAGGGPHVAVVGSLNADLTFAVDRLPVAGETILSVAPAVLALGGKGGNQAAAAAAFGARVSMIGRVGDDDYGRKILADLIARGVDVSATAVTAGSPSGTAIIAVDGAGSNLIIVDPGANGQLRPDDLAGSALRDATAVLIQLEIPWPTVAAAARAARGLVILNPAPAAPIEPQVLDLVDVLVPNAVELGLLSGTVPPQDLPEVVRLARKLATDTDVVVTLGGRGAIAVGRRGGEVVHVPAPRSRVTDTTGAGDCFCGTLAVSLSEGMKLPDAVRLSVAAAAISVTAAGARGRLPGQAEAIPLAASIEPSVIDVE
jgi:ribokinase